MRSGEHVSPNYALQRIGTHKVLQVTFETHAPERGRLRKNDVRVFFVTADGMICGCTEYRQFISDSEILRQLRELVQNAN